MITIKNIFGAKKTLTHYCWRSNFYLPFFHYVELTTIPLTVWLNSFPLKKRKQFCKITADLNTPGSALVRRLVKTGVTGCFGGFSLQCFFGLSVKVLLCLKPPSCHTSSSSSSVCTCNTCRRVWGQHVLQEILLLRGCSIESPGKAGNGPTASAYPQEFHHVSGLETRSISH